MKTLLDVVKLSTEFLQKKGFENARRQAEELIADAIGIKRIDLYMLFDRPLTNQELELCRSRLRRRGDGEPNSYIHGEVEFYNCKFKVNPKVLIPRQETEILVDEIAKELKTMDLEGKTLLDLCCGSGCIGISLKKQFPTLKVIVSDLSEDALAVAKENATLNEVDIEFLQGNLLEPLKERKIDLFVCNPPYIAENEYASLDREVRDFEPRQALISGSTGLECYEQLAKELPFHLNKGAKLWFEMGAKQAESITKIFKSEIWIKKVAKSDWAGHDRFFLLEIE